jgi:hypothetical protein
MDKQAQAATREETRRIQDAARKGQERVREASDQATRMAGQMTGIAAETASIWLQVNQRLAHDLMEMSADGSQRAVRLLTDLQHANMQAFQELQAGALRWLAMWPESFRDPVRYYQRTFDEGLNGATRVIDLGQRNAEAVTHSLEQVKSTAQATARGLQQTFHEASGRMHEVFQRAESLPAA